MALVFRPYTRLVDHNTLSSSVSTLVEEVVYSFILNEVFLLDQTTF